MPTKDSTYNLQSKEETSRLANQHNVIKDKIGGLLAVPVDFTTKPLRVLNSATADDINSSQWPQSPPARQIYQIQDITKPWPVEWKASFDLVHQRLVLAAGGSMQRQTVANLADMVKPRGWIQLIEATNESLDSHRPAFRNFVTMIKGVYATFHASLELVDELPVWLKEAGLVDVQHRDIDTKLGAANPDTRLAKQGVYATTVASRGLVQYALTLPEGTIPLSYEQIAKNAEELKAELAETGATYRLRVVWARKPSV